MGSAPGAKNFEKGIDKAALVCYNNYRNQEREDTAMTIEYTYTTDMLIILDDEFEIYIGDTLDVAVEKAKWAFNEYGFTKADIIDKNTGEILVIMRNEG